MKKKILMLLGVTGATVFMISTQANAEDVNVTATTEATVTFSKAAEVNPESPNPENPGTVTPEEGGNGKPNVPGGGSNTENDDLKLMWVPNFLFGQEKEGTFITNIKYDYQSGNKLKAARQLVDFNPYEDAVKPAGSYRVDNFVQVYNSGSVNNWTLKVARSEFSSLTSAEKNPGFQVAIKQAMITTGKDENQAKLSGKLSDIGEAGVMVPAQTTDAIELMTYEGTGVATNTLIFGSKDFYKDNEVASEGVELVVPKGKAIKTANEVFTSTITWTLTGNVQ